MKSKYRYQIIRDLLSDLFDCNINTEVISLIIEYREFLYKEIRENRKLLNHILNLPNIRGLAGVKNITNLGTYALLHRCLIKRTEFLGYSRLPIADSQYTISLFKFLKHEGIVL